MPECKDAQVLVLCEDRRHYHLVRGFLEEKGFKRITERKSPPGSGSAEQFVREQFPIELRAHRARARYANVLLIVCVDRDRAKQDRIAELAQACSDRKVPPPADDDPLLVLIPARNIETWLYLIEHGPPVDETTDYKPRCRAAKPGRLGRRLAADCSTINLTRSLVRAQRDWRRLCG
ncbi:MAG: hypothetical protein GVY09_08010 [Gammaproteobacteria bacterium]|jgi:hypothetical protein|nr:hypothetical protein [Gammaproteobacteria bacterium]